MNARCNWVDLLQLSSMNVLRTSIERESFGLRWTGRGEIDRQYSCVWHSFDNSPVYRRRRPRRSLTGKVGRGRSAAAAAAAARWRLLSISRLSILILALLGEGTRLWRRTRPTADSQRTNPRPPPSLGS